MYNIYEGTPPIDVEVISVINTETTEMHNPPPGGTKCFVLIHHTLLLHYIIIVMVAMPPLRATIPYMAVLNDTMRLLTIV